jgi:peroxiredoxin family protein
VGSVFHTSVMRVRLCKYSLSRIYVCYIIHASRVTISYEWAIFVLYGTVMALRKNRVRSLHDRLKLIHEVKKNPAEKRVDIAKDSGCRLAH